jgi:chromosome partitioning protein
MNVLTFVNHKGGVGKTTLSITVGHRLAMDGQQVVIIDLDSQGSVAQFLGLDPSATITQFMERDEPDHYLVDTGRAGLRIVSNSPNAGLDHVPISDQANAFVDQLGMLWIAGIQTVIIDSPPSVSTSNALAFLACDSYVSPARLDRPSILGAREVWRAVERFESQLPDDSLMRDRERLFLGMVPTFWDRRRSEDKYWIEYLYRQHAGLVLPPIPTDAKLSQSLAHGQTIWEYAPRSRSVLGATEEGQLVGGFTSLTAEIKKRLLRTRPWLD